MNFLYRIALLLIAAILSILCHTFFANIAPIVLAITYSLILFAQYFRQNRNPYWFLISFTLFNELLSHNKPGTFVFIACEVVILEIIFAQNLHFTARYNRYIISNLVFLLTFPLLLVTLNQYYPTLLTLIWSLLTTALITSLVRYWRKAESYEFI